MVSRGGTWAGDKVCCVAEEGIISLGLRGYGCRRWGLIPCRLKGCTARVPCVYQGRAAQDARVCYWVLAVNKLPIQDEERQLLGSQFRVECGSCQECLQAICKESACSCVQQLLSISI